MENQNNNRRLAAILFADIAGYTTLMQQDEQNASTLLRRFQKNMEELIPKNNGQIINFYGDGALCIFNNPLEAVRCAMALQNVFSENPKVPTRIGLHMGTVVFENEKIYGDSVNIASRIESMGVPDAVLFSKTIRNEIKNQPDIIIKSLGHFAFKNVEEEMEVFALANEGFTVPKRNEMKSKGKMNPIGLNTKYLFLAVGILGVIAFLYFNFFGKNNLELTTPTNESSVKLLTPGTNTIAVLPLRNLNQEGENLEYFSDGVTQEIIDELAKVKSIKVSAFTHSLFYKNQEKPPLEIATEMNVQYLIAGSSRVFENGKKVKLSIELFNPFTNERLWNGSFEETMQDAPTLQLTIAKKVVSSLNIELTIEEIASLDKVNTTNGEAFRLFLQAKSELDKYTKEAFKRSQALLNEAIRLDSSYAQAYTLLAWSLTLSGDPQMVPNAISAKKTAELTESLIAKSLALSPKNSDTYLVRSSVNLYAKNQIGEAKKDIDIALELKSWPRVPTNYCTCTIVSTYVALRNVEKAKEAAKLSKEVDPGNILISWDQANIFMLEGKYGEAQKLFHDAVNIIDDSYFNTYLGWSYYHGQEYEKALKYLLKGYNETSLPMGMNAAYLSNTYFKLGDTEKSDQYLQELLDRSTSGERHMSVNLAMIYASQGNNEKALDSIERAFENEEFGLAVTTSLDPVFERLYNEPRFIKVRQKMGYYD